MIGFISVDNIVDVQQNEVMVLYNSVGVQQNEVMVLFNSVGVQQNEVMVLRLRCLYLGSS